MTIKNDNIITINLNELADVRADFLGFKLTDDQVDEVASELRVRMTFDSLFQQTDHMIYEVTFIDNCVPKTIPIVAIDVTQALGKLEPHLNIGIPEPTLKWMLGSERIR